MNASTFAYKILCNLFFNRRAYAPQAPLLKLPMVISIKLELHNLCTLMKYEDTHHKLLIQKSMQLTHKNLCFITLYIP